MPSSLELTSHWSIEADFKRQKQKIDSSNFTLFTIMCTKNKDYLINTIKEHLFEVPNFTEKIKISGKIVGVLLAVEGPRGSSNRSSFHDDQTGKQCKFFFPKCLINLNGLCCKHGGIVLFVI